MIRNVYILYIDTELSHGYVNDCLQSIRQFPELNPIPVLGYTNETCASICEKYGMRQHEWRAAESLEYYKGSNDVMASVDAGHMHIWQMIIESGEPGIVLEHKTILKGPVHNVEINDGEIIHFGPRVLQMGDYTYPAGTDPTRVPIQHWEGAHAYGITPNTARKMFDDLSKYGYIDSVDPMLAFRNTFDLKMYTLDPPPIIVVNGDRKSTWRHDGVAAFWNAVHTPKFLANMKPGAAIAPLRHIAVRDRSFDVHMQDIDNAVRRFDGYSVDALVLNSKEGYEALKLGNRILLHDESQMMVLSPNNNAQLVSYNAYFCWNYTKIQTAAVDTYTELLYSATSDPEIAYDIIYYKPKDTLESIIVDVLLCWKLLKSGGILFIDDMDDAEITKIVKFVITSFIERDVKVTHGTSGITSLMRR